MATNSDTICRLLLSKHLFAIPYKNNQLAILNRSNGIALLATGDLLSFLDEFKKPISIEDAKYRFQIDNLEKKIDDLLEKKFLLDQNDDEEIEYIIRNNLSNNKKRICGETFNIFYPKDEQYLIHCLHDLLKEVYSHLIKRGFKKFLQKAIVFVCENEEEAETLWGTKNIPITVDFFVSHGKILTIRPNKIYLFAIADEKLFKAMTHEMIHIFLYEYYTNIPIWCIEGLCEYYSANVYPISLSALIDIKGLYRFDEFNEIAKHSILDIDASKMEFNIAYRQSASFIAYLANLLGEERLMECVLSTGLSKDFKASFMDFFNYSLNHYEIEWRKKLGYA